MTQRWEPIETAPKDGRDILMYCECWDMTFGEMQIGRWEEYGDCPGYWLVHSEMDLCDVEEDFQPTHWMSLPEPPVPGERTPEVKP